MGAPQARVTPHKGLARPTWHTSKRATIGFEPPGTAIKHGSTPPNWKTYFLKKSRENSKTTGAHALFLPNPKATSKRQPTKTTSKWRSDHQIKPPHNIPGSSRFQPVWGGHALPQRPPRNTRSCLCHRPRTCSWSAYVHITSMQHKLAPDCRAVVRFPCLGGDKKDNLEICWLKFQKSKLSVPMDNSWLGSNHWKFDMTYRHTVYSRQQHESCIHV